ncbi:AbrB family transcriptional regulator [Candidatus Poribacteria bacterium]|nr:MAG: AbrB family transcriptional regulator [Candidatus Poribacteria bacterium]
MPVTTLTSKGQITIPKEIREKLGLKPMDRFLVTIEGEVITLRPLKGDLMSLAGSINPPESERPTDFQRVREKVKEAVAQGVVEELRDEV